uniref:CBM49 domain-containing protein n=1 Tax=Globodera pallida TaxID=36090 RepID=A0A183BZ68_GLOPA
MFLKIFFIFALLPYSLESAITLSSTVSSSWSSGQNHQLVFTNSGTESVCSVTFSILCSSGTSIASSWNMNAVSGSSTQYTLPSWVSIAAGGTYTSTGLTTSGTLTLNVDSYSACSGSSSGGSSSNTVPTTATTSAATTTTSATTTTTSAATTTTSAKTTTTSGTTATTTSSSSSTSTTLVVLPVYTTADTCLSESEASGPITSHLNIAITGGKFTFYGIGGRGACGLETDTPLKSAAASGTLFNSSATWVASCMADSRYMLNDPICMNKCVKIEYNGKT